MGVSKTSRLERAKTSHFKLCSLKKPLKIEKPVSRIEESGMLA